MATPYSTPRYPGAPNPTPRSTGKALKPPIHNPYDKFTQPEFDAWINNITGALKCALGREDAPEVSARRVEQLPTEDDEVMEDSFAEVRARRLAKGKERARDEDFEEQGDVSLNPEVNGWGLPIEDEEYGSESEEESEEESPKKREVEVIDLLSDDDGDAQDDEQEEGLSDEEPVAGPAPVYDEDKDEDEDEGSGSGEDEDEASDVDSDEVTAPHVHLHEAQQEDGSEADQDGIQPQSNSVSRPSTAHEVTEILDSDDEDQEQQRQEDPETRAIPARFMRKPVLMSSAPQDADEEEFEEVGDEEQAEEGEGSFPTQDDQRSVEIEDPWQGPRTFAEDFYAGGELPQGERKRGNPHILPKEEEDELVEVEDEPTQPPDIHDPWEGPRTFAEDFYAGGDAIPLLAEDLTPSHLTPRDDAKPLVTGITDARESEGSLKVAADVHEVVDVDELYADMDDAPELGQVVATNEAHDEDDPHIRSPSPLSATLSQHVDWNWPPAFPGKVATGPGHLAMSQDEFDQLNNAEQDVAIDLQEATTTETDAALARELSLPTIKDVASGTTGSKLYPNLEELYDMGPVREFLDVERAFEPVNTSGIDFGDLPPSRDGNIYPALSGSTITGDGLTEFVDVAPPTEELPGAGVSAEDSVGPDEPSSLIDNNQSIGSQSLATIEPVVVEVDDDTVLPVTSTNDVDVVSVPRDDLDNPAMEYIVEEAVTEGRRTVEPETLAVVHGAESRKDASAPETQDEDEVVTNSQLADAEAVEPERLGEFPAPVSADPNVPDPAVIASTPVSPASLRADSETAPSNEPVEFAPAPAHIALLPVFRKISHTHSASGLFTPLTAGTSGSTTPERQEPVPDKDPAPDEETVSADNADEPLVEAVEHSTQEVDQTEAGPGSLEEDVNDDQDDSDAAVPTDSQGTVRPATPPLEVDQRQVEREGTPGTDADTDAEGEVDVDYVPSASKAGEDLFALPTEAFMGQDDTFVAKESMEPVPPEGNTVEPNAEAEELLSSPVDSETDLHGAEDIVADAEPAGDKETEPAASQQTETVVEGEVRPLKRKRRSPAAISDRATRITRSKTIQRANTHDAEQPQILKSFRQTKGKGKQRARAESDDDDGASVAGSHASSAGSSAIAQQMLVPESRGSSRASSVVSNAPSMYSQPSPTLMRTLDGTSKLPPPSFVYDHGVLRHHHGGRPLLPPPPVAPRRQPSRAPSNVSESSRRSSAEPAPSDPSRLPQPSERIGHPSQPSQSHFIRSRRKSIATPMSSPVTRANCQYHLISVPREEDDGRRLFFAVPGCSLGDGEVMKEEEIEDHGFVKAEDIPRLITHIERLKLSHHLLGVLRQLVGVDLLREQEVFYLPQPGDGVFMKRSHRAKLAQRESISARTLSNRGTSRSQTAPSKVPVSQASVSTSGGSAGKLSQRTTNMASGSISESELSELDDEDAAPPLKRTRGTTPEQEVESKIDEAKSKVDEEAKAELETEGDPVPADAVAPNGDGDAPASTTRRRALRRTRKLGVDAAAYRPEGDGSDGSGEEETSKNRKRTRKGGVKRARTEDGVETVVEETAERPKRRRVRAGNKTVDETASL